MFVGENFSNPWNNSGRINAGAGGNVVSGAGGGGGSTAGAQKSASRTQKSDGDAFKALASLFGGTPVNDVDQSSPFQLGTTALSDPKVQAGMQNGISLEEMLNDPIMQDGPVGNKQETDVFKQGIRFNA